MKDRTVIFLIPVLGTILGFFIAQNVTFVITEELSLYLAVGLVITADILAEAVRHYLNDRFVLKRTLMNYVFYVALSFFFLKIGYLVRVDLYIALFIVFGIRLFSNLSYISQKCFSKA